MTLRGFCRSVAAVTGALALLPACALVAAGAPRPGPQLTAASWSEHVGDGIQPGRIGATAVFDAPRNRVIVFAGASGPSLNDTWALDLATGRWTELATTGAIPSRRQFHSATLDPRGNMVIYGGTDGVIKNDIYRLDLTTLAWQKIEPSTRGLPAPYRSQHGSAIVISAADTSLFVFGGTDGDSLQNTVYRFVLGAQDVPAGRRAREINTWKFFPTASFTPPPGRRLSPAVAPLYVTNAPAETSLVVMGGNDGPRYYSDLWVLNVRTAEWESTRVDAASPKPAGRTGHASLLDQASGTLYVFGGYNGRTLSDTWAVSLATRPAMWSARDSTQTGPESRSFAAAALTVGGLTVLAGEGGTGSLNDAWTLPLAAGAWQNLTPSIGPPSRYGHVAAYAPGCGQVLLFGGTSSYNELRNDAWSYDPTAQSWSRIVSPEPATNDSTVPRPRTRMAAAYVPGVTAADDTLYVFGGWTGEVTFKLHALRGYQRILFALAPGSGIWRRVIPADTTVVPDPRESGTLVYDAVRRRLVLFGGFDGSVRADTWAFDLATRRWTQLASAPAARYGHLGVVDASGARMVITGGSGVAGYLNDTQTFDLATNGWSAAGTTGVGPKSRLWPAGFVDPSTNSLVVFGGAGANTDPRLSALVPVAFGDTIFALDLSTYAWRIVASGLPVRPVARFLSTATYVPAATPVAVLFGGGGRENASLSDTWTLDLSGAIDPLATAEPAGDGSITIRWRPIGAAPDAGYTVLRAAVDAAGTAGEETAAAVMGAGAPVVDGWIEAHDRGAAPGATYRYAVLDLATGYRTPAGDVEVPAIAAGIDRARFFLRTPSAAPLMITVRGGAYRPCPLCMRPMADAARIGLFDVRGRLVRSLDLSPTDDAYAAVWDGTDARGRPATSGLYVVRMTSVRGIGGEEPKPARLIFVR